MKKTKIVILIILSIFFMIPSLFAISAIVSDSSGINIRKTASVTENNVLAKVKYNTELELVDNTLYTGDGCDSGWYKVKYNNQEGYVCSLYVNITSDGGYVTGDFIAKVNTSSYISVRSLPDSSSTRLDKLITGTRVTIISKHTSGNGCDGTWLYVSYHADKKGYVCGKYISTKEELILNETDYTEEESAYAQSLLNAGFTASYIPYLMKMHRDHPTWNFVPFVSNLKWKDIIDGEEGRQKIESTTTTVLDYYIAKGAVGTEGGNWYNTNSAVDAYFIDPRNFLSEVFIFIFEDLVYNPEYHTSDIVKDFFGSSYLSNDEYVGYFMEAAEKYKVSPLHLAARVWKEGAGNEQYGAITGTYNGSYNSCNLTGYYNYYNIGSYSSWVQGLYYAAGSNCDSSSTNSYGRPWKSRKEAILGGANFIASNYVSSGQNTLYFQKFNTSTAPYYTGQYMTNIMAPTQEGESIYNTLKSNQLLDKQYTFIIPVYKDMPETVSLPNIADSDNSLSDIKINDKTIENFDPDILEYNYYVTKDTEKISLNVTPTKSTSTLKYNKEITLETDEKTIEIIVTAQNGDKITYIINIKKVESVTTVNEILEKLSVKVTDTYMKNISINTSANSLILNIKQTDPNATINFTDSNGNILTYNTNFATGQKLTIVSSGGDSKTFNIAVKGDTNGDGKITILDLLQVQKHLLNSQKLNESYYHGADTNDDNNITILDLLRVQKHLLGDLKL